MTTSIEWARNADGTPGRSWNATTGCVEVSPGCDHCYARTFAERWRGVPGHAYEQGFDLKLWPDRLQIPLRRRKPTTWFVNSMSDLWHADVPREFIAKMFAVMAATPRHTYQILTKRPGRMRLLLTDGGPNVMRWGGERTFYEQVKGEFAWLPVKAGEETVKVRWPLPNVWLGVSAEDQHYADTRIPELLRTPAAVRFVSYEPALGPLDLDTVGRQGDEPHTGAVLHGPGPRIGWVIAGGESGPGARGADLAWFRQLRDQCAAAGTAYFQKQLGARPVFFPEPGRATCSELDLKDRKGGAMEEWPEDLRVRQMPVR